MVVGSQPQSSSDDVFHRLRDTDRRIDALGRHTRRSLGPGRGRATTLVELATSLSAGHGERLRLTFARGLGEIGDALAAAFPENLFWDLDALASAVLSEAREDADPCAHLESTARLVAELQHLFGQESSIRFRYIHDFVYGFDWSKWVRRDPRARGSIGPFDRAFVVRMHERGGELLELISEDDTKYPRLEGGGSRNPFAFSREPRQELELFRTLARRQELPVNAWERHPSPRIDRDFYAIRERAAEALASRRISRPD